MRAYAAGSLGVALACAMHADPQQPEPAPRLSFAVLALSRAQGVPEPARAALGDVRVWLEEARLSGDALRVEETRVGLEGETRLCAEFTDAAAHRALRERIAARLAGLDLISLRDEPCNRAPN